MKGVKKMLLGIAMLIVATMGAIFWIAGSIVGTIIFFMFVAIGGFLCVDGYLSVDKD